MLSFFLFFKKRLLSLPGHPSFPVFFPLVFGTPCIQIFSDHGIIRFHGTLEFVCNINMACGWDALSVSSILSRCDVPFGGSTASPPNAFPDSN